ncbi:MAG: CheW-like protein [Chloroflexi bacterium]|nr:CheW-like protein [Chloroflexota bacterium]
MASQTPRSPPSDSSALVLLVSIGGQAFALPTRAIEQLLPMAAVTPVPEGQPGVAGVLNLHGEPLAVVDPRPRMGFATRLPALDQHLVVVAEPSRYILWVDGIDGVTEVGEMIDQEDGSDAGIVSQLIAREGQLIPVLSLEALAPQPTAYMAPTP